MTLEAQHVMTLYIDLEPPRSVGGIRENMNIIPIAGGTFEGPQLRGIVCRGGADWNTRLSETVSHASAQYWLETDDGYTISVSNEGIIDAKRSGVRIKTTPRFETAADSPYAFLLSGVFVGELTPVRPGRIRIDFYQMQ